MSNEKVQLRIDPDALTIGDLEDFEEVVGEPLYDSLQAKPVLDHDGNKVLDEKGRPELATKISTKALKALIWITQRVENPEFTIEDARNVRVGALEIVAGDEGNESGSEPA